MSYLLLIFEPRGQREARSEAEAHACCAEMVAFGVGLGDKLLASESLSPDRHGVRVQMPHAKPALRDGPFTEAKEMLGGFYLLDCASLDEAVAIGAAIQGGVLAGDVKDVILLDVTPLSLGIETLGGVLNKLIDRNTTIPTRKSQVYTTAADNQTSVEIHVLQGERPMATDNRTLARFSLTDIPPAPRGIPQIEVTFDIDANGIVNVSAKDLGTGKEQRITVTASTQLTKEEVDRMVRESQEKAQEDERARELAETRNRAESMVYATEKSLKELGDKVSSSDRSDAESAIQAVREAMNGDDKAAIEAALSKLEASAHKLAEQLYQPQGGTGSDTTPPPENPPGGDDGDVIDADFRPSE